MPLDPQVRRVLELRESAGIPPLESLSVEKAREIIEQQTGRLKRQPVARIENLLIPGPESQIPARVYRPSEGTLPVLVSFHGGGWVTGSIETHEAMCRALANLVGCLVVSVGYRRPPEHRFPTAVEDAHAAIHWVATHGDELRADPTRLAVGGESSGGNVAAAVALMARDRACPTIQFQILIFPVTDYEFERPSWIQNARGYLLTGDLMRWFWSHYLGKESDGRNPYASPLRATDLSGLPPGLIVAAEFDPLRDQQEAYARRLREAGVPAEYKCYEGMVHGFTSFETVDRGKEAIGDAATRLRQAFGL